MSAATAYHEAGHAVVAWALGLYVGTIEVREDAGGGADIGPADHLSLVDQIAICSAGYAAERLFGVENHERASATDHAKIARLLEAHGVSEEERGPALRDEGHERACAFLLPHKDKMRTLADLLMKQSSVSAESFDLLMRP
jgi:ATP-dependent Zn protease